MLHEGQRRIVVGSDRFNPIACGRRFGKTTLGVALAWFGAPKIPGSLAHGYDVGWFAPTYKLLDEAFRSAEAFLRDAIDSRDKQQKRLELSTGASMDFWTLEDPDAGRGRKYGQVIVDEAAMARNLRPAWEQAIRPTLTDYAGGAWFFSTPKGRNFFYELHRRGGDQAWPGWKSHHAPTRANPYIDPDEVEDARRSLPERVFAQEYEAAFLEDGGGVFRRITDAIDDELPTDPYTATAASTAYVIGVDWARHEDFTVIVVIDAAAKKVVAIDRFTEIEYSFQLQRLKTLAGRFPSAPILAESNSMGEPLIEQLRRDGLQVRAFHTSAASKAQAIESLALAFEQGELRIPRFEPMVRELMAYDQERLPSGAIRYGAPSGEHDDCVMALAIAWHGVGYAAIPDYTKALKGRHQIAV